MGVNYTDEQRNCVESLIGPVDVSAGAGSGKTFTLTQRIAEALVQPDSGVDDIDQICAITFTEKAAAELKGRVRSTLRSKGLFQQALKVDGAWISTIHGMCARILRAHALELGLDPAFQVMGEAEESALFSACLNQALKEDKEGDGRYKALTSEVRVESGGFGSSIEGMVRNVLNASLGLEEGPRSLRLCDVSGISAGVLARQLLCAYEELIPQLEDYKEGAQRNEALECARKGQEALAQLLEAGPVTMEGLRQALDSCKFVRKLSAKAIKPACEDCLAVHYQVVRMVTMAYSGQLAHALVELSCSVEQNMQEQKQRLGKVDNNDLLLQAKNALQIPAIAADYSRRFRLVMVDEFQDTDSVQLAIVSCLAGPGLRYLCTVGDAQQSIYGFRGADIAVYEHYRQSLDGQAIASQGGQPKKLKLTKNFRSHGDVLAFVRAVCNKPQMMESYFLDLEPTYDGRGYKAQDPRIQVEVCAASGRGDYSSLDDARTLQALRIAQYFKRMHDQGHPLSHMVLLLGTTTHANKYAEAIRRLVGPCVVAGGSLFSASPEAVLVGNLLKTLANPMDTKSLFAALSSPLFALGAQDFLRLSYRWDYEEGQVVACSLDKGLIGLEDGLQEEASPQLAHAVAVLNKAWDMAGKVPASDIVMQVLQDSGYLMRLEQQGAEGLAQAGNLLKAVRLVQGVEEEGAGLGSAWKQYAAQLEAIRETPGTLNVGGQEAVRIMTIHASKGLEFPIVALADMDRAASSSSLVARKMQQIPFLSLKLSSGKIAGQDQVKTAFDNCEVSWEEDASPAWLETLPADQRHVVLAQLAQEAERRERQRLFYVGATRAKEALCVFVALKSKKEGIVPEDCIAGDVRIGLFGAEPFPEESCLVEFGGSEPLAYRVSFASCLADEEPTDQPAALQEVVEVPVPEVRPAWWMPAKLAQRRSTGLFSYSSFSALLHDAGANASQLVTFMPEMLEDEEPACKPVMSDKDKATDFGSALHRLCQIAALQGFAAARNRVEQLCQTYGVGDSQRLREALENWLQSDECAQAYSYGLVQPELPFSIQVGSLVMEGEIDLMCTNAGDSSHAVVVDYKTGGHPGETLEQLGQKHGLQAQCYAYAVLSQGYEAVDLVFYRVEQSNSVKFSFTKGDLPQLEKALLPACGLVD